MQHLFVHLFAIVFHDYTFYARNVVCSHSLFFLLPHILTFVAASISHFLTAAVKFWCFSSNEIGLSCWVFLALALSRFSTLMETLKFSRTKNSAFLLLLLLFFLSVSLLKSRWPCDLPPKRAGCLKCKVSPLLTWRGGRTYVRTILSKLKFLERIDNQIFLPMVHRSARAPL